MKTKNICRRFTAIMLSMIMVLTIMPSILSLDAFAADITGLSDEFLGVSADDDSLWTVTSGNSVSGSAKGSSGSCASAESTVLTFTNGKPDAAMLSFNYTATAGSGTVKINGVTKTGSGVFSEEVAAGATVTVSLDSPKNASTATTIAITNLLLLMNRDVTLTASPAVGGSITINGTAISAADTAVVAHSTDGFTLSATVDSGYEFVAWRIAPEGSSVYFIESASYSLVTDLDSSICPVFAEEGTAMFRLNDDLYYLDDAISTAVSGETIILFHSGSISGNYTIPNGLTLLIPYNFENSCQKDDPELVYNEYALPYAYKTLTMTSGSSITVANGAVISVSAKIVSKGQFDGYNGCVGGAYGHIVMESNSNITVQNGGVMYTYGYVSGSGSVTVQSGGTIWELFQIKNWRGGTITWNNEGNAQKIFLFNQYYVQNVECPLTIAQGATERMLAVINVNGGATSSSAVFIGNGGMFYNKTGSIRKYYNAEEDRLIIESDGDMEVAPMSFSLYVTVNTDDYVLPLVNNMTIDVLSGTCSITQDFAFLPGSRMNIRQGATMKIREGKNVYVYDAESWDSFVGTNRKIYPLNYSVAAQKAGHITTSGSGTSFNSYINIRNDSNLTDATIDINGKLIMYGKLYTTCGTYATSAAAATPDTANPDNYGANIISSQGTGTLIYATEVGTETTTAQFRQQSDKVYIPIEPAKLRNGPASSLGAYTATVLRDENDNQLYPVKEKFVYNTDSSTTGYDSWEEGEFIPNVYDLTYHTTSGGEVTVNYDEYDHLLYEDDIDVTGEKVFLEDNADAAYTANRQFLGWTTIEDWSSFTTDGRTNLTNSEISANQSKILSEFIVDDETTGTDLYPVYASLVNISWCNDDGTEFYNEQIIKGSKPAVKSSQVDLDKECTDEYHYEFDGWYDQNNNLLDKNTTANEDKVYTATFFEYEHSFTWQTNVDEHWKICSCGYIRESTRGAHTFGGNGKCTSCSMNAPHPTTTVTNGATVVSEEFIEGGKYWLITVQAPMTDASGNYFTYWKDQDGYNVGTYRTYAFYITKDTTLTPVYTAPSEYAAARDTKLFAARIVSVAENPSGGIRIYAERAVSSQDSEKNKINLNSHGFVATLDSAYGNASGLDIYNEAEEVNVFTAQSSASARTGLFTKTLTGSGDTLYVRAYVIDGSGEVHYGPLQTFAVGAILHSADDEDAIVLDGEEFDLTETNEVLNEEAVEEPGTDITYYMSKIIDFIKGLVPVLLGFVQSIFSMIK